MTIIDDLRSALGDGYNVERELGGGGMSRVFVGEERAFERKVAIKVLAPELAAGVSAERFQREIKLAGQLQHPNIVPVITAGTAGSLPYYTMPFVDGLSLRARLERNPGVPIVEAIAMLKDVARALAYAHDRGIVHRDIKPENVLLADEAAVVTDFGIAKALAASRTTAPGGTLTQTGTSIGTPAYMAPEQIAADPAIDHRADLYSFGCVAYEVLSGSAPFSHHLPHQLFAAHLTETPAPLNSKRPDIPVAVAALVMKCLEKDAAARPASAREILRGLDVGAVSGQLSDSSNSYQPAATGNQQNRKALIGAGIVGAALVVAVGAYFARGSSSSSRDIRSLAVLPFENIGGDTANTYFAEGMSDELSTELARVPGLTLASRNSAAKYRGADPMQIGNALDVGAIIDGNVRRAGDDMRVTVQLTNASNGKVIWSNRYQQKVQDVFAVQDSITAAVVRELKLRLSEPATVVASGPATSQGTTNLEAYDLYLRGRYFLQKRGESLYNALDLFEQATTKDPNFARAYAGYAMAASVLPQYTSAPIDSITPIGLKFGRRAIQLDPTLADAYLGIANLVQADYNWKEAAEYFKKALAIEPNNASAHQWYGDLLWLMGRANESLVEVSKAVTLDPASAVLRTDLTNMFATVGDYDKAHEQLQRAIELDRDFPYNDLNRAGIHFAKGQYDSVLAIKGDPYPPYVAIMRMRAYRMKGDQKNLDFLKDSLGRVLRKPNVDADGSRRTMYFAALGNKDSTFYYLNRAVDKRGALIFNAGVACFSAFDFLHSDPRWPQVLKRLNIQDCQR